MACQKVSKQGTDYILVKVNLQSPIPTSFYIFNVFYLAVISNLDKLVQPCCVLPLQIRPQARPRTDNFNFRVNKR